MDFILVAALRRGANSPIGWCWKMKLLENQCWSAVNRASAY